MGNLGLVMCLVVGFVAFVAGWMKGCEYESARIRNAFTFSGLTSSEFYDTIEKYEQVKEAASLKAKREKKKWF